jgi:hypothetical protein
MGADGSDFGKHCIIFKWCRGPVFGPRCNDLEGFGLMGKHGKVWCRLIKDEGINNSK